jgi:hypothetical protein
MLPHNATRRGRKAYYLSDERRGVVIYQNMSPPGYLAFWEEIALCKTGDEFSKHFSLMDQEEWVAIAYFFQDMEENPHRYSDDIGVSSP